MNHLGSAKKLLKIKKTLILMLIIDKEPLGTAGCYIY